jgi:HEAT repeat protein
MKQPDASRALETALHDAVSSVRLAAVAELKRLGTRSSQSTLLTLARTDPDSDVRHAATLAVARRTLPGELNVDARSSLGS